MFKWFDRYIFNHVGRTIQRYAIISLIVDILVCVISAFVVLADSILLWLLILVCGIGYALIFAFPIYAFGQLVEDIHQTQENTSRKDANIDEKSDRSHVVL